MNYRKAKEVLFRKRERFILCPIPEADGYWMCCHPSVEATCPRCLSKPGEPCRADRGHVVLTSAQAQTVKEMLSHIPVTPARRLRLRERLRHTTYYRARPHEERIKHWRDLGLNKPGGKTEAAAQENLRSLIKNLNQAQKRVDALKEQLK